MNYIFVSLYLFVIRNKRRTDRDFHLSFLFKIPNFLSFVSPKLSKSFEMFAVFTTYLLCLIRTDLFLVV
jgi:hypothetical protein